MELSFNDPVYERGSPTGALSLRDLGQLVVRAFQVYIFVKDLEAATKFLASRRAAIFIECGKLTDMSRYVLGW